VISLGLLIVSEYEPRAGLLRSIVRLSDIRSHVRRVNVLRRRNRAFLVIGWYFGRFELLTGIVFLGAAAAIFAFSDRRRTAKVLRSAWTSNP